MLGITIIKQGVAIPSVLLKGQKRLLKEIMIDGLLNWRKRMLPKHFERGAPQRYKYQARTDRYKRMKRRRGLGPLVYSGAMRSRMIASNRRPTGSSKQVTLRLPAVGFVHRRYKRKDGSQWKHTMADEIRKHTAGETRELCERMSIDAGKLLSAQQGYQKIVMR